MQKTSCIAREPMSKLDEDGKASILNYNLPQSTTYEIVTFVLLDIQEKRYKTTERQPPPGNYWEKLDFERQENRLDFDAIKQVVGGQRYTALAEIQNVGLNMIAEVPATRTGVVYKAGNIPVPSKASGFSSDFIANKINDGFRPVVSKRPSGLQGLTFQPRPTKATPRLYLVMKMRMASYLGDYGAGQTLSTFSLLPGEKTVIEIVDYRHREETRSSSQSVLDSYSESAMDDLQTTIESQAEANVSVSETDVDSMAAETSGGGKFSFLGIGVNAEAGASASSVNTMTESVSSTMNTMNSAVSHHVQTADTQRQIEINTDVTSTDTTSTTTTTTRTLENINRSRVLNFAFRQLLQAYDTITYLDDVSFVYTNGFDNSRKTAALSTLENLLSDVLIDRAAVDEIKNQIYIHLCGIPDHTGTKVSFIEKVTEKATNCIEPGKGERNVGYVRKRKGLQQAYKDKVVDGIILNVTSRVLRTPAVIVDAVLGQGEALDCYNQELQEAAFTTAHLANRKTEQALAILDAIDDPIEKARFYNNVFGTCCGTPQDAGEED